MLNVQRININKFGNKSYIIILNSLFEVEMYLTNIPNQFLIELKEQKFFSKKVQSSKLINTVKEIAWLELAREVSNMVYNYFNNSNSYAYTEGQRNTLEAEIINHFFLK